MELTAVCFVLFLPSCEQTTHLTLGCHGKSNTPFHGHICAIDKETKLKKCSVTCPRSLPLICDRDIGNQELLLVVQVTKSDFDHQREPKSSFYIFAASYSFGGVLVRHKRSKLSSGVKREKSRKEEGESPEAQLTIGAQNLWVLGAGQQPRPTTHTSTF